MTAFKLNYPAVALILLLVGSSEVPAQQPKPFGSGISAVEAPQGLIAPLLRVTGARASSTLTTAIHCSNSDVVPVSITVSYFDNDNNYVCGITYDELSVGSTSTFSTVDTAAFDEDRVCPGPPPVLGQGRIEIGTFPLNARIICSAQVVSLIGSTPATLSSLDVFPAN
ncbi:MAG: hypothetical protein ABI866_01500 [Dokdonella sp.]